MKGEDGSGARLGIEAVGEMGLDPVRLVTEGQGVAPSGEPFRQALGVFVRLGFHAGEVAALLVGLDDTRRLAVHVEQVIGEPVAGQGELSYGRTARGVDVGACTVLHHPAGGAQQLVDGLPGGLLRGHLALPWGPWDCRG